MNEKAQLNEDAHVQAAIDALRAGEPVILPTDTVYGLVAAAEGPGPTERLYGLKGRDAGQPSALMTADLETLLAWVPELRGRDEAIARALLPGPYTLILSNPAQRFGWLTGTRPLAIGVRVPHLPPAAARVVGSVGAVASTSANAPGGRIRAASRRFPRISASVSARSSTEACSPVRRPPCWTSPPRSRGFSVRAPRRRPTRWHACAKRWVSPDARRARTSCGCRRPRSGTSCPGGQ